MSLNNQNPKNLEPVQRDNYKRKEKFFLLLFVQGDLHCHFRLSPTKYTADAARRFVKVTVERRDINGALKENEWKVEKMEDDKHLCSRGQG